MKKYKEIDDAEVVACLEGTLEPVESIARLFGVRVTRIVEIARANFTPEFIDLRKRSCYGASKQGNKNPMWGIDPKDHPRYKGEVANGNGYVMVLKPDWFTGRKGSKHVFQHTIVMCEYLGLTELPKGTVIHHIDHNRSNNSLDNLALMTMNGHSRLHSLEAQRLGEIRREQAALEAHRIYRQRKSTDAEVDGDIVHSSQ